MCIVNSGFLWSSVTTFIVVTLLRLFAMSSLSARKIFFRNAYTHTRPSLQCRHCRRTFLTTIYQYETVNFIPLYWHSEYLFIIFLLFFLYTSLNNKTACLLREKLRSRNRVNSGHFVRFAFCIYGWSYSQVYNRKPYKASWCNIIYWLYYTIFISVWKPFLTCHNAAYPCVRKS